MWLPNLARALRPVILPLAVALLLCAEAPAQGQPRITALQPPSAPVNFVGLQIVVLGSNFNPLSVVLFGGTQVPTVFMSSTRLTATVNPPLSTQAGSFPIVVAGLTGASNPAPFTLTNRVPQIFGLMPTGAVLAGQGTTQFTVDGAEFAQNAVALWDGVTIPSNWLGRFTLQITVPAALLAAPRSSGLRVVNPAPGGGPSNLFTIPVLGPVVAGSFPPVPLAPTGPSTFFVTGSNFSSNAQLVVDGASLPTIAIDSSTLRTTLPMNWPGLQRPGALVVNVVNPGSVVSNTLAVSNVTADNRSTLRRTPLTPAPGTAYSLLFEDGVPLSPLTIIVDAAPTTPLYPWPSAALPFVLGVRPFPDALAPWATLGDGLGLYGPANGFAFSNQGTLAIGPITLPAPPLQASFQVQAVSLDPIAPTGFRLSWMKVESL